MVGTTTARWLIDRSALRIGGPVVQQALTPRVARGLIGICIVTEDDMIADLVPVTMPTAAEQRARLVQAELVARGQHRAVGIPDLLVAAVAEVEGLTVLHYDKDFDLVAHITGQSAEWTVPPGTL